MNCIGVGNALVSSLTINWLTDVIVPLASAVIGGLMALVGVCITLKRDKLEREHTQRENARPFFAILDDFDRRGIPDNTIYFNFIRANLQDDSDISAEITMVNSDKCEFIINKLTVSGDDYLPIRQEFVAKGMVFSLLLCNNSPLDLSDIELHLTDINHQHRIYKLKSQNNIIQDFVELQNKEESNHAPHLHRKAI